MGSSYLYYSVSIVENVGIKKDRISSQRHGLYRPFALGFYKNMAFRIVASD